MAWSAQVVEDFAVAPEIDPSLLMLDPEQALFEPMTPAFTELFNIIMDSPFGGKLGKRDDSDDSLTTTLTGILLSVKNSGIIQSLLHEIADSDQEMNNLSSSIYKLLSKAVSSGGTGLNVSISSKELLNTVMDSGLIQNTVYEILYNDTVRDTLADGLNKTMSQFPWIIQIVNNLGHKQKLTFDMVFDTARNFKSKMPEFQSNESQYDWPANQSALFMGKQSLSKRDDNPNAGSLSTFANNLLGSAVEGGFVNDTLTSVLKAVDNSGIAIPVVLLFVGDMKVQKMTGFIANKLYNYGVFDAINIDPYYQKAKKTGILSKALEYVISTDIYSKPLTKILNRVENDGGYTAIRRSLHGPQRY